MIKSEIQVVGLKEVLREINQIDKAARRQITKEFKQIGAPVVEDAKRRVPEQPPLSGWGRSWTTKKSRFKMLPWDSNPAARLIDVKVSGKRPKEFAGRVYDLAVVVIRWRGMVNTVYDLANKSETPQGATMVSALARKHGPASRVMWPAYESNADKIEDEIRNEVEKVMAMVNVRINKSAI